MKIKASAKIKRRYLLMKGRKDEIEKTILDYIGILGWAKASVVFVKTEGEKSILSVERKEVDNVRAAFEASNSNLKVLRVSGTLKGLRL